MIFNLSSSKMYSSPALASIYSSLSFSEKTSSQQSSKTLIEVIFWFEITGFGSSSTLEGGSSLKSLSDSSGESSTLNMILSKSSILVVGISIVWPSNFSGSWMLSSSLNDSRLCSFWFVGKPRIKAKLKKKTTTSAGTKTSASKYFVWFILSFFGWRLRSPELLLEIFSLVEE